MKPQFAQVRGKASPRRSTDVLPIAWSSVTRSSQPCHSSCPQNGQDGRAPRLRKKSKIGGFAIIRLATVAHRARRDRSRARPGRLDRMRDGEGEGDAFIYAFSSAQLAVPCRRRWRARRGCSETTAGTQRVSAVTVAGLGSARGARTATLRGRVLPASSSGAGTSDHLDTVGCRPGSTVVQRHETRSRRSLRASNPSFGNFGPP